jgi:hypothetical protein
LRFYSQWRETRTKANAEDNRVALDRSKASAALETDRATRASDLLALAETRHAQALKDQREEFRAFLDRMDEQLRDLREDRKSLMITCEQLRKQIADRGKS